MHPSSQPGSTPNPTRSNDVSAAPDGAEWYRQPILWLGALIFLGSLAGCLVMIVLA